MSDGLVVFTAALAAALVADIIAPEQKIVIVLKPEEEKLPPEAYLEDNTAEYLQRILGLDEPPDLS